MEEVKKQGTESLFVPYKIALELKKLGFFEECLGFYIWQSWNNNSRLEIGNDDEYTCETIKAPLYQQTFRFFREKYDIEVNVVRMPPEAIKSSFNKGNKRIKKYNMWVWSLNGNPRIENPLLFFDNYEEALEAGLQEALKLIK